MYCSFWNKVTLNRDIFKDKGRSIVFIKTWLFKLKCLRLSNIKPTFCCILTFVVMCDLQENGLLVSHSYYSPLEREDSQGPSLKVTPDLYFILFLLALFIKYYHMV